MRTCERCGTEMAVVDLGGGYQGVRCEPCGPQIEREHLAQRFTEATTRYVMLAEQMRSLSRHRAQIIREMRASGMKWEQIAEATGISRQRLDQLLRKDAD